VGIGRREGGALMARCIWRMQIGVERSVRYCVRSIGDFASPRNADICFRFRSTCARKVDGDLRNFGFQLFFRV
jgi:hypothetical protein